MRSGLIIQDVDFPSMPWASVSSSPHHTATPDVSIFRVSHSVSQVYKQCCWRESCLSAWIGVEAKGLNIHSAVTNLSHCFQQYTSTTSIIHCICCCEPPRLLGDPGLPCFSLYPSLRPLVFSFLSSVSSSTCFFKFVDIACLLFSFLHFSLPFWIYTIQKNFSLMSF